MEKKKRVGQKRKRPCLCPVRNLFQQDSYHLNFFIELQTDCERAPLHLLNHERKAAKLMGVETNVETWVNSVLMTKTVLRGVFAVKKSITSVG